MTEAWTWEHLAMTRARPIAGDPGLMGRFEDLRCAILRAKGAGATVLTDVAEMRARIAAAKSSQGVWDAKLGPGRLQDVELIAQMLALRAGSAARDVEGQIAAGVAAGLVEPDEKAALCKAAALFWQLQAAARLLTGGVLVPDDLGEGGRRFVLRETGAPDITGLQEAMGAAAAAAGRVIDRLLAASPGAVAREAQA